MKKGKTFNMLIFEFDNKYKKIKSKVIVLSIILRPINKDLGPLK